MGNVPNNPKQKTMRKIVLDIETQNTFRDVGSNDPKDLDISLLVVYDYQDDTFKSFLQADFPKLWKIIETSDMIIGFNSDHFDIPLLNKYYPGDITKIKSLDLLVEIEKSIGRRVRLDDVAEATLGKNKIAHGLEAIEWWKTGEIEKIREYCEEDVRITKEVYEYALKNKRLKYKDLASMKEFPVNTSQWETAASVTLNYTLPF